MAVPGHRSHVLHRADRLLHRAPRGQPVHVLTATSTPRRPTSRTSKHTYGVLLKSAGSNPAEAEEAHQGGESRASTRPRLTRSSRRPRRARIVNRLTKEKAEALRDQLHDLGRRGQGRAAGDPQLAQALRRADQPAEHQPHRGQHLHPDLLVGHHGAGPCGHPAGQARKGASSSCGATVLIGSIFLSVQVTNITS